MNLLRKKIETVMIHGSRARLTSFFETFLYLISLTYAGVANLRALFYEKGFLKSRKLPCPVISIGNMTVGGTGKTPLTIYVTGLLKRLGYKVAVISRGYRGDKEQSRGIVSNKSKILLSPDAAGDEPYLMAVKLEGVPVLVGRDRFEIGMLAIREFAPDVLVLDDAFQHLQLYRDLDLVLLDAVRPFGNGHLLPRGVLREPLNQLVRGDAFILTRLDPVKSVSDLPLFDKLAEEKPVFRCKHVPDVVRGVKGSLQPAPLEQAEEATYGLDFLKGRRVLAFAGIAGNEDFRMMIADLGCDVASFLAFPDHHRYSDQDLKMILRSADQSGVDCLLTTEKDYVRIAHRISWPLELLALGIKISFGEQEKSFNDYLKKAVLKMS